MRKKLLKLYDIFVGNKENHIEWDDTRWIRRYSPITPHLLKEHIDHEIAIGSYPIYTVDNVDYCKWICMDVDAHQRVPKELRDKIKKEFPDAWKARLKSVEKKYKKGVDEKLKMLQHIFCSNVASNLDLLKCERKNILYENSGGGFHIWIFLKPYTTLENVGKYIETVKPEINKLYKELTNDSDLPEFYPKQYSTEHLEQKCGNGVRIPFGKNKGKDRITEVYHPNNLNDIVPLDVIPIAEAYEGPDIKEVSPGFCAREEVEIYDKEEIGSMVEFWYYFPYIRPCFKSVMDGSTQCYNTHGHRMRMALVHELVYYDAPKHVICECFKNQYDYDPTYTRLQVDSILRSSRGHWKYSCDKIKQIGYCENDCRYNEPRNKLDIPGRINR